MGRRPLTRAAGRQAAANTKQIADQTGDAAVRLAKDVAPKIQPAAERLSAQAEEVAHRVAEEGPQKIDKAAEVPSSASGQG